MGLVAGIVPTLLMNKEQLAGRRKMQTLPIKRETMVNDNIAEQAMAALRMEDPKAAKAALEKLINMPGLQSYLRSYYSHHPYNQMQMYKCTTS